MEKNHLLKRNGVTIGVYSITDTHIIRIRYFDHSLGFLDIYEETTDELSTLLTTIFGLYDTFSVSIQNKTSLVNVIGNVSNQTEYDELYAKCV